MDHVIDIYDHNSINYGPTTNNNGFVKSLRTNNSTNNSFINGAMRMGFKPMFIDSMATNAYSGHHYKNYQYNQRYRDCDEDECNSDVSIETSDDEDKDQDYRNLMFSDDDEDEDEEEDDGEYIEHERQSVNKIIKKTISNNTYTNSTSSNINNHKRITSPTIDSLRSTYTAHHNSKKPDERNEAVEELEKIYVCFCVESNLDFEKIEKIYMNDTKSNEKPSLFFKLSYAIPAFLQKLFYEGRQHCEIGIRGRVFTIYRGKYVKMRKKYPSSHNYTYLSLDVTKTTADHMFKLGVKLAKRKCGYDSWGLYFNHISLLSWMYSTDYRGKRLSEKKFTCSSLVCYILEKGGIITEYPEGKNVNNTTPDDLEKMLVNYYGFMHTTHVSSKNYIQKHQSNAHNDANCKSIKVIKK